MADRRGDIAVERIHRALAARAPEELVERQVGRGGDTIARAGCLGDRVREDDGFRIDERRKRIILPERIDLGHIRSEEHTSELQSLMRISYAVFCLKKKKNINNNR